MKLICITFGDLPERVERRHRKADVTQSMFGMSFRYLFGEEETMEVTAPDLYILA